MVKLFGGVVWPKVSWILIAIRIPISIHSSRIQITIWVLDLMIFWWILYLVLQFLWIPNNLALSLAVDSTMFAFQFSFHWCLQLWSTAIRAPLDLQVCHSDGFGCLFSKNRHIVLWLCWDIGCTVTAAIYCM